MIPFNNRFHGHSSLRYVYKNGQVIHARSITIKTVANSHRKESRVAVIIGKKIAKSAVSRNRIRRRVYEYIYTKLPYLNRVYDIVFIVSSSDLLTASHHDMSEQLDQLFDQSGILRAS
jgi:ribonuclease P protein component, eubacterial